MCGRTGREYAVSYTHLDVYKRQLPIQRITIVPRTSGALGYVWQVPEEEKQLQTKKEMEEDIVTFLAGRAAEELKFDSVTNGASNDIEKATSLARTMITMYGMSEKFGMVQLEGVTGEYLDNRRVLNCSSETETKVDTEVKKDVYKRQGYDSCERDNHYLEFHAG